MTTKINDFVIQIATTNGSGSQSANNLLVKSIFRMGIPVGGKNMFPSNIAGLPTWFNIRVNQKGYLSRNSHIDLAVVMNKDTLEQDLASLNKDSFLILNSDLKYDESALPPKNQRIEVSFKKPLKELTKSGKLKKLLANMIYVGLLAELLGIDKKVLDTCVEEMFSHKPEALDLNKKAIAAGVGLAQENGPQSFSLKLETQKALLENKVLIDGNTASALGLIYGGCSFLSWYPITPSSSISESFHHYAEKIRKDSEGKNTFAIVQSEDELSAVTMALGAGWAGCRALTCTSGPGLSLMAETAGLSYFAEVPLVIWDVQRGGPSTGLPTRTQQADVLSAATLSHGDTEHVLLFPSNPKECFDFGRISLDLAEELQTLVIVLSDLDLGMNFWVSDAPSSQEQPPLKRGKVLSKEDIEKQGEFNRYKDLDGDGIPYRTLPGTSHPKAGYFSRGTSHKEDAGYSESPIVYKNLLDRLKFKMQKAKSLVPKPKVILEDQAQTGIIYFGSTSGIIEELKDSLNHPVSTLGLLAYPFTEEVQDFIEGHQKIIVVEQNRDGQMRELLIKNFPQMSDKIYGVQNYDGFPIETQFVLTQLNNMEVQ